MARDTIVDRLLRNARERGSHPALHYRDHGRWSTVDWKGYAERCRAFAGALLAEGYEPGQGVAIMGENSPEWLIADVGAMMARAVAAGIYQTCTGEQAAYVAGHCDARVVVLEHKGYYERLAPHFAQLPHLRRVVLVRDAEALDDPRVQSFEAFCERGRAHGAAVDARFREVQDDDLATLIYTSGTTGPPKGVMLTHRNLAATATTALEVCGSRADDRSISYLPLSHIAEQVLSIHVPITAPHEIFFAGGLDKLKDTLLEVRPTTLLAVPRVWEKFRAALEPRLAAERGAKGAVIRWARGVGARAGAARLATGRTEGLLALEEAVARRLFFAKLRTQLGLDRLRLAVTGAAPIGRDVLEFFLSCGVPIHEVYGQTEGSGLATFNRPSPGGTRLGTVGPAMPGTDVKLAPDGEILVRGPGVSPGYLKDEAATAATFVDGWLHSGDIGEFDAGGFLRITDRKKDLLITSGGKNVAPQNIEKLLRAIDGIGQAMVIGDRRHFITALLTLDPDKSAALARAKGWPLDRAELARHPEFVAHVQAGVDRANAQLARYESVRKFTLLPEDFTQESGELTPTQKLKRKVVLDRHARAIEAMYAGESAAGVASP